MTLDEIILIVGWIAGFALNAAIALVATWFLPVRRRALFFVCMVGAAVLAVFVASSTTMTVGNIAGYLINFIVLPCLFWKGSLLKRLICAFLLIVIEFVTEILLTGVFAFALFSLRQSLAAKRDAAQAEDLERQLSLHVENARAADAELQRAARFRHDQRNHLQVVLGLIERGQTERAAEYVGELRRGIAQEGEAE